MSDEEKALWILEYMEGLVQGGVDKRNFLFLAKREIKNPFEKMSDKFRMFILGQIPFNIGRERNDDEFNGVCEVEKWASENSFYAQESGFMIGERLFVDGMKQGRMFFVADELKPIIKMGLSACDTMVAKIEGGTLVAHISYKHTADVLSVMKLWSEKFGVKSGDVKVVMTPVYSEIGVKNHQLKVGEPLGEFDTSPMDKQGYMDLGVSEDNIYVTSTENDGEESLIENNAIVYVVPPYGIGIGYVDVQGMKEIVGGLKQNKGFLRL